MKVKVFPYREKIGMGNMMWSGPRFEMRGGKFPKEHPVGGGSWDAPDGQGGSGENIKAFRARGYWASCFPEGDGITWKPLNGQNDTQCMIDIRDCFAEWDVHWAVGSNAKSQATDAALSRQVACTDGLGGVPPAPTFGKD